MSGGAKELVSEVTFCGGRGDNHAYKLIMLYTMAVIIHFHSSSTKFHSVYVTIVTLKQHSVYNSSFIGDGTLPNCDKALMPSMDKYHSIFRN